MTNTARNITGSKYEATQHLDIAEIAKMVRADVKELKKRGMVPASAKVSVRIDRYAGGQSIHMNVKGLALDHNSGEYKELRALLDSVMAQYNFDNSDPMVDYFSVRFYGWVNIESPRA